MGRWENQWRAILAGSLILGTMLLVLPGCGGDGESAWVTIDQPTAQGAYETDQQDVFLAGYAFVPPGSSCTGDEMFGTVAPDFAITWRNAANDSSGTIGGALYACSEHYLLWSGGSLKLEMGKNRITVTASLPGIVTGQDEILITRVPDVTPPVVTDIWPGPVTPIPSTAAFLVYFNEMIDFATLGNGNVTIRNKATSQLVSITLTTPFGTPLGSSGTSFMIQPGLPLLIGATYLVQIENVLDLGGNPLPAAVEAEFSTQ